MSAIASLVGEAALSTVKPMMAELLAVVSPPPPPPQPLTENRTSKRAMRNMGIRSFQNQVKKIQILELKNLPRFRGRFLSFKSLTG
jgi:hypothetical protein